MMANVGDRLKQAFSGWKPGSDVRPGPTGAAAPLRESRKTVLYNGPLECRFFRFELVAGDYRPRASRPV
jgi:putative N6-adenine-specific DNA methylase